MLILRGCPARCVRCSGMASAASAALRLYGREPLASLRAALLLDAIEVIGERVCERGGRASLGTSLVAAGWRIAPHCTDAL